LARRASAIEKLRQQDHGTIIVDAGDALLARLIPPPTQGDLNKAEAMMRAHGLIGLDAMAVGEAELGVGLPRLRLLQRQTSQTLLCANLVTTAGKPVFEAGKLLETGGVKVGLAAVLELPLTEKPSADLLRRSRLKLADPVAAARAQVAALKARGAELMLLLAHVGMDRARDLARQVKGIHLVLVAHSGQLYSLPIRAGETYLVEPGRRGQDVGHVQFRLGPDWAADQVLTDDSPRHVLYTEAAQELAQIARQPSRRPASEQDPRLLRARSLAQRLQTTPAPSGKHFIVARLVTLDDAFTDNAAVKGLMNASRASWHVAPVRSGTRPVKIQPLTREQVRQIQVEQ